MRTREAAQKLRSYPYPGNVRELENAVRRAVALCPNDMITVDCLPPEIAAGNSALGGWVAPHNEQTILGDRPTMDELQRRYLQLILDENQGKKRRVAMCFGRDRRTVQRLIGRYNLRAVFDQEVGEKEDLDAEISSGEEEVNIVCEHHFL